MFLGNNKKKDETLSEIVKDLNYDIDYIINSSENMEKADKMEKVIKYSFNISISIFL